MLAGPETRLDRDFEQVGEVALRELCRDVGTVACLRGPETRSSSLRCGFVFVDEATEQVSAVNVVEIDDGLCPWWRFFDRRSMVQ